MKKQLMIKQLGSQVLRQQAEPITEISSTEIAIANQLKFWLKKTRDGYGLAANQIGIVSPIFVYKSGRQVKTIVNPRMGEFDDKFTKYDEGCLSIPGYTFPIWRPEKIHIFGQDLNGETLSFEATGFLSRLMQHEIDHLKGVLIIDLLNPAERELFLNKWNKKKQNRSSKK